MINQSKSMYFYKGGSKIVSVLRGDYDYPDMNVKKWIIIKNYLAVNVAFVLVFSSKNSVNSLQPLIHQDKNLGNIGQLVSFCVNIATSIVLPQVLIEMIGFKFTLALGVFLTTTFVIVQIFLNMTSLMIVYWIYFFFKTLLIEIFLFKFSLGICFERFWFIILLDCIGHLFNFIKSSIQ